MYSRDGAIHFSALKMMAESPLHYAWFVQNDSGDTPSRKLGRAVHAATLQGIEPFVFHGDRRGSKWTDFVAEYRLSNGVIESESYYSRDAVEDVLTTPEWDKVRYMRDSIFADKRAYDLLKECTEREVDLSWTVNGHPCKGRIDARNPARTILVEVKTTKCAKRFAFLRDAERMNYDAQLPWYDIGQGKRWIPGSTEWSEHYIVAVENVAPFATQVYHVSPLKVDQGYDKARRLIDEFSACVENDGFRRAYSNEVIEWDADLMLGSADDEEETEI